MLKYELIDQIPCANILGEGVQWNHREQAVWWVDIKSNKIFRYHLASKELQSWATPEPVGCFAFAENDERILLALASGFAWFDKNTGAIEWLAKPEANLVGNRLNDGRVDRQGRFWAGSIVEQKNTPEQCAGLFCLDVAGQASQHLTGLAISNSLCWSLDSKKLYHADSPTHQIKVYDFDATAMAKSSCKLLIALSRMVAP
jgi:sugar lactone lactonase YvrE